MQFQADLQGIVMVFAVHQVILPNTLLHHQNHSVPVNPQFSKGVLTENSSHQACSSVGTTSSQMQVEALTPCMQQ